MATESLYIPKEQVTDWLMNQLRLRNIIANIHTERIRAEQEWLYVRVHIQGILQPKSEDRGLSESIQTEGRTIYLSGVLDAHDIASILQEVEDAWNYQEPPPEWKLLLIPAAN